MVIVGILLDSGAPGRVVEGLEEGWECQLLGGGGKREEGRTSHNVNSGTQRSVLCD